MSRLPVIAAMVLALAMPAAASAICIEPSTPYGMAPRKPDLPFCASSRSCTQFEVTMYQQEMDTWFQRLKQYVEEAQQYAADALAYAQCKLKSDD